MVRKNKSPPLAYKASDGVMLLSRYWNKLVAGLVESVQRPFLCCAKITKLDSLSTRTTDTAITASYVVLESGFLNLQHELIELFIEHESDL